MKHMECEFVGKNNEKVVQKMSICEKVKKCREGGPKYEHLRKSQKNGEKVVQHMNILRNRAFCDFAGGGIL